MGTQDVRQTVDVAVVGGGVMGAALATWLRTLDPSVSVAVVEREIGRAHV